MWVLPSFPKDSVNAWVAGDLLIDAQTRRDGKRIVKEIGDRPMTAHVLTHAHPDHQGASHHVCTELGLPLLVHELDADAVEDPKLIRQRQPNHPMAQLMDRIFTGPAHPVDRTLADIIRRAQRDATFRKLCLTDAAAAPIDAALDARPDASDGEGGSTADADADADASDGA